MNNLEVVCPTCKKKFSYYSSSFRPFCTHQCRLLDLGLWLSESYAVPQVKLTEEEQLTLEQITNEKSSQHEES
jgi:endogenous inhibitor of DNA gyrase (YacG/DUF329 family)